MKYNVLAGRWLPLLEQGGSVEWASPIEVLCGEKDGLDLDYPRDDFRVYARLLLSAIVQALFAAPDRSTLKQRLEVPLSRAEAEAVIRPHFETFDLFGETPFLQVPPPAKEPDGGAAPFVFITPDLYQPAMTVADISLPIALVTLFAEQTYAGGAGRGYGAGPGGQPGAFTLIDAGSVRRSAWANSLALDTVKRRYAPDDRNPVPWSSAARTGSARSSIGVVEGLFWQPRGAWLVPVRDGRCSFSGIHGELVRLSPLVGKSTLAKKVTKGDDFWPHPCAPLAVNSQGTIGAVRLNAHRPAWTGLAQLLDPISKPGGGQHPLAGPAAVLQQWRAVGNRDRGLRLIVLDFDRDKAIVRRRFFEGFTITQEFLERRDLLDRLRLLVDEAQSIERALARALKHAYAGQEGGQSHADASSSYWASTEAPFLSWLSMMNTAGGQSDEDARIQAASDEMAERLRRSARSIFDSNAELCEFHPSRQQRVALARRRLLMTLWPREPRRPSPAASVEVKP